MTADAPPFTARGRKGGSAQPRRMRGKTKERMTRLYAQHCRRPYRDFERAMDRDRFMSAEEALEWGLIDRIVQKSETEAATLQLH